MSNRRGVANGRIVVLVPTRSDRTESTIMSQTVDVTAVIDTYLAAYNETDAAARQGLVDQAFAADATLIDPPLDGAGRHGISEMMGVVHQPVPGHTFRRASAVDEHHGHLRYAWELLGPDGNVALAGIDVGELDASGQLVRVVGFFGPLAGAGAAA
jgi:hypothetical protein